MSRNMHATIGELESEQKRLTKRLNIIKSVLAQLRVIEAECPAQLFKADVLRQIEKEPF